MNETETFTYMDDALEFIRINLLRFSKCECNIMVDYPKQVIRVGVNHEE